jgi:hypothetical protein
VYLDDVSVYSLVASRLGPIAAEFTETETRSLQSEVASSVSVSAGVAKSDVRSRMQSGESQGSQVLRKSIVQTTFKELYELEEDTLAMTPMSADLDAPEIRSVADLEAAARRSAFDGWIVNPKRMARGQLLELEVDLDAEPVYRMSAVVTAVLEIMQDIESLGTEGYGQLTEVHFVNRILEKLLAGLVPVRGRAVDYGVVVLEDTEWLVHRRLLSRLRNDNSLRAYPLYLVGVAEQALFWKDIRRILFSGSRFRVLSRLAQDGLRKSWTPVKLVDVLRSAVPDLALQVDIASRTALAALGEAAASEQSAERKRQYMREALIEYARLLANHYGRDIAKGELIDSGLPSADHCNSYGSLKGRRDAFKAITRHLEQSLEIESDPLVAAQYRAAALVDAGLSLDGEVLPLAAPEGSLTPGFSDERFLDTEIVAIYW